jgi:tripartite-type tricarboxylate transporter receptor subunit TctC
MNKFLGVASLALACAFSAGAHAQAWPSKPVRVLTATATGGTLDITARLFAASTAARGNSNLKILPSGRIGPRARGRSVRIGVGRPEAN